MHIHFMYCTDDLRISPDFFDYMHATYPLLVLDRTLMCVSAWNDNGRSETILDRPGDYFIYTVYLFTTSFGKKKTQKFISISYGLSILIFAKTKFNIFILKREWFELVICSWLSMILILYRIFLKQRLEHYNEN